MILVDTSIWIDHFRASDPWLADLLRRRKAAIYTLIIGELAMGSLRDRHRTVALPCRASSIASARDEDVLALVEKESLFGTRLSFVDAHLLAAALGSSGTSLWTRDRRLALAADRLGLSAAFPRFTDQRPPCIAPASILRRFP